MNRIVRPSAARDLISADSFAGLDVVHAGGRLVEDQQRGLGRQRPGDLEPALVAVGQRRRPGAGRVGQPHPAQAPGGLLERRLLVAAGRGQPQQPAQERGPADQVAADQHVLQRRQAVEQLGVLEGAAHARRRHLVHRGAADGHPEHRRAAGAGRHQPADHVHQRRLAGAVGSDQPDDLAAADLQVDVPDGVDAAVLLAQPLERPPRCPRSRGAGGSRGARAGRRPRPSRRSTPACGCAAAAGSPDRRAGTGSRPAAAGWRGTGGSSPASTPTARWISGTIVWKPLPSSGPRNIVEPPTTAVTRPSTAAAKSKSFGAISRT